MGFFTINTISQKSFGREKRWLFYFLASISMLANLLDIAFIGLDTCNPILYINTAHLIAIAILIVMRYFRKIPAHCGALGIVYLIIINISVSLIITNDQELFAQEFLRYSLYIWMTTLIAGFLVNRNHVLIIEIWHIVLLLFTVASGNSYIVDNQIMLFLAITIFSGCLYYIIFLLDKNYITNRKLLEAMHYDRVQLRKQERRLLREDETKNRLFSIISHDLKSNSNLLLNFSILLQKRILQQEYAPAEKMCDAIYQAADNNHNLLVNLLEWTRAQSETIEFRPTLVDAEALLAELKNSFEQTLATKHLSLQIECVAPKPIRADGNMLASILRNLLSNAIKFSPIHTTVSISVQSFPQHICFRISDNGIGMCAEKVAQLQHDGIVNSTRGTADEKGSGLGFSISRYFVEKHNGTITVSSIEGKGTEVQVNFPQ